MKKKIYKYCTGDQIPAGAEYLSTVLQASLQSNVTGEWMQCHLVWHYFLVEVSG